MEWLTAVVVLWFFACFLLYIYMFYSFYDTVQMVYCD